MAWLAACSARDDADASEDPADEADWRPCSAPREGLEHAAPRTGDARRSNDDSSRATSSQLAQAPARWDAQASPSGARNSCCEARPAKRTCDGWTGSLSLSRRSALLAEQPFHVKGQLFF